MTLLHLTTEQSAFWDDHRYVRPIISRRLRGIALEVDLAPGCFGDHEDNQIDIHELSRELNALIPVCATRDVFATPPLDDTPDYLRELHYVTIGGSGEPTSCPQLAQVIHAIHEALRRNDCADVKVALQTDATLLHRATVIDALQVLDEGGGELWCQLDTQNEALCTSIANAPMPTARVISNIIQTGRRRPIVLQTLFVNARRRKGVNQEELSQYIQRLEDLEMFGCRIKLVQVYTISNDETVGWVSPASEEAIDKITASVHGAGFKVASFYSTD